MPKDQTYHESAIQYNEILAVAAEEAAEAVEHPEIKKWCRSIGKQHRFHAKRHRSSLTKLQEEKSSPKPSVDEVEESDEKLKEN